MFCESNSLFEYIPRVNVVLKHPVRTWNEIFNLVMDYAQFYKISNRQNSYSFVKCYTFPIRRNQLASEPVLRMLMMHIQAVYLRLMKPGTTR